MKFQFTAIETNNAKIKQLTRELEQLRADNARMENIQTEAEAAIAQLESAFFKMIDAGIDKESLNQFRAIIGNTLGIADNSTKVEQQERLISEQDKTITSLREELVNVKQQRDDYESMWNVCVDQSPLPYEEEILDLVEIPTAVGVVLSENRLDENLVQQAIEGVALDENRTQETAQPASPFRLTNTGIPVSNEDSLDKKAPAASRTFSNDLERLSSDIITNEFLNDARALVQEVRQTAEECKKPKRKTSKKKPIAPTGEAIETSNIPSQADTTVRVESVSTEASQPVEEQNPGHTAVGEEEDEIYPLNARPGNVFRTAAHSQVLMLARHPKQWLGQIIETGEMKKFFPSDIVSFKYSSSRRTQLIGLDKTDINNFFALGETVVSSFSNAQYGVISSNPVETSVSGIDGKETMFLTSDLARTPVEEVIAETPAALQNVELTDREREIIEEARNKLADGEESKAAIDTEQKLQQGTEGKGRKAPHYEIPERELPPRDRDKEQPWVTRLLDRNPEWGQYRTA